jgi:hypothetical protein
MLELYCLKFGMLRLNLASAYCKKSGSHFIYRFIKILISVI